MVRRGVVGNHDGAAAAASVGVLLKASTGGSDGGGAQSGIARRGRDAPVLAASCATASPRSSALSGSNPSACPGACCNPSACPGSCILPWTGCLYNCASGHPQQPAADAAPARSAGTGNRAPESRSTASGWRHPVAAPLAAPCSRRPAAAARARSATSRVLGGSPARAANPNRGAALRSAPVRGGSEGLGAVATAPEWSRRGRPGRAGAHEARQDGGGAPSAGAPPDRPMQCRTEVWSEEELEPK